MTGRISVFLILASMAAPAGAGLALVGNENGGTISLIDTARDEVVGEIKTGGKPRGAAIHASRKLAYVSDQPNNALLVIDLGQRIGHRHLQERPQQGHPGRQDALGRQHLRVRKSVRKSGSEPDFCGAPSADSSEVCPAQGQKNRSTP